MFHEEDLRGSCIYHLLVIEKDAQISLGAAELDEGECNQAKQ